MAAAESTKNDCPAQVAKILRSQYSKMLKDTIPNLICVMDENDVRIWYGLIFGVDDPLNGEYIFKLTANNDFPHKPPRFEFITPNGIYEPGGPICISVGEYHTNDNAGKQGSYGWRPVLGMYGFAKQVLNGLLFSDLLGSGIRIIKTNDETKAIFARQSIKYNDKYHANICKLLKELPESSSKYLTEVRALYCHPDNVVKSSSSAEKQVSEKDLSASNELAVAAEVAHIADMLATEEANELAKALHEIELMETKT